MTASDNRIEIRRLRRLLKEIADLAQGASLTGSLSEGAPSAIRRYNVVLQNLERLEAVTPGFFTPLAETAGYDELGVESKLLAGYIKEETREEEANCEGVRGANGNVIIGLGGLRELGELKDLGKMIRDQLPAWLRGQQVTVHETSQSAGGSERVNTETFVRWDTEAASLSEVESRLVEVGSKLQTAAEQLRRGDLSDEERALLAEQLSRLGQEQANLARRHALLRERV